MLKREQQQQRDRAARMHHPCVIPVSNEALLTLVVGDDKEGILGRRLTELEEQRESFLVFSPPRNKLCTVCAQQSDSTRVSAYTLWLTGWGKERRSP